MLIKVDSSSSLKTMVSENHLKLLEAALRQTDMPGPTFTNMN